MKFQIFPVFPGGIKHCRRFPVFPGFHGSCRRSETVDVPITPQLKYLTLYLVKLPLPVLLEYSIRYSIKYSAVAAVYFR